MAEKKDKKEINIVDQNAIWRETIRKENRCQKLYTQYHINPYKPSNQVSGNFLKKTSNILLNIFLGKPNSQHDTADGEEDAEFLNIIHKVRVEPRKKYSEPITETQVKSYETVTYQKRTICTNLVLFLGIWLVLGSPSKRQLERPSSSICDY